MNHPVKTKAIDAANKKKQERGRGLGSARNRREADREEDCQERRRSQEEGDEDAQHGSWSREAGSGRRRRGGRGAAGDVGRRNRGRKHKLTQIHG